MNREDFYKTVVFTYEDVPEDAFNGYTGGKRITARIGLNRSITITKDVLHFAKDPLDIVRHAKERLRRELLGDLYDDRRKELMECVNTLVTSSPYSNEFYEARNKICAVALQQPSADIYTLMKELREENNKDK